MVQLCMTEAYLDNKLPTATAGAAGAPATRQTAQRFSTASATASTVLQKLRIGIVGGTGYTGVELLRILARHPHGACGDHVAQGSRNPGGADVSFAAARV